ASASTTIAFFPPSSSEHFLSSRPQISETARPTSTLPVKYTAATSPCRTSASPASSPNPNTTFTTPGGRPASSRASTNRSAQSGVSSAGLSTAVLPAMIAGNSFHDGMAMGKFHGVMHQTTPKG